MLCGCVLHQTLVALTRVSKHGSAMDRDLWADMENSSVLSIQHLQISSPKTFRQGPPSLIGKSELVPGQVVPASTTQEFHVKYKYTLYEQTHKCLVNVFYLCIDILPDVNLNVLIIMQNLCEYSISCKNSKYEFYIKILNSWWFYLVQNFMVLI